MSSNQSDIEPYYPLWFTAGLLEDEFPWDRAVPATFARFLELYTLHDSSWIALKPDVRDGGYALAAIRFDSFWTEGRIPHPGSAVAQWPILLLRIHKVREIRFSNFEAGGGWPRSISFAESVEIDGETLTSIVDIYEGRCELVHSGPVDVLLMSREGEAYALDDLRISTDATGV